MITEDGRNVNIKNSENQSKSIHGVHLTRHHGVGLGQPRLSSAGLFLGGEDGGLRGPEADLNLTVLPSCLEITVLGRSPLPEDTPGVVAVLRIGGVRRQGRHGRCSVRGPAGPGKRTETVIHNKPIFESEYSSS